jgi:Arylsulfotransferase (ASST)
LSGTKEGNHPAIAILDSKLTRRAFLVGGTSGAMALALSACGSSSAPPRAPSTASYRSRPDLHPVLVDVKGPYRPTAPGYVMVTPSGPLVVDNHGQPVWIQPVAHASTNLRVQRYQGQPVLTWWQGEIASYGVGIEGEYRVIDTSYRTLMTVKARNGLVADLHEFLIAPSGVAYFTAYRRYRADLRSVGGPSKGTALDAVIQGVDLTTGDLVFEWHSASHIPFSESHASYSSSAPYDPVHLNSIDPTRDGNLLVSARNTWTVYKLDAKTGTILWRLGGKSSDFRLEPGVRFAWQHDARGHAGNLITLFDDEGDPPEGPQSRGLVLEVEQGTRSVSLLRRYVHPGKRLLAGSQGSLQVLPNRNVLVGWGAEPYYTEYTWDGATVLDAKFAAGQSYRAFRFPWTGRPTEPPAVAAADQGGRLVAFASWNGSTETTRWDILGGSGPTTMSVVASGQRSGFETAVPVPVPVSYVAARAVDDSGTPLATSPPVKVSVAST